MSVCVDRSFCPSFTRTGPDHNGHKQVHYLPKDSEQEVIGLTDVKPVIYDPARNQPCASATLKTP